MSAEAESGTAGLVGRRDECEALDRLIADVLAGASRVIVLRGEAGVGKSALLNYLSDHVAGWRVARASGVESEMELAYSGLHQLCAPMLDHLERLPLPQHDALMTVFGRRAGPVPERFLVALATLTLLAEVGEEQPLVCIVDDAQWLDQASAQIIGFVARRLFAERVAVACAARTGIGDNVLAGLPELSLKGLGDADARALLLAHVSGPLDAAVSDQIIAESHGNPLALLELPRTRTAADLAGGFGLPGIHPVVGKVEQSYARRLVQLPSETQLLVLAAAAEPVGDPMLLGRAARTLGVEIAAVDPAVDAGLLHVGGRVEFAHPLVRSTAYRKAAADDRHRVHRALAEATDPETDPDRRAWHLAAATAGPDEEVASDLERSAARAQTRGGIAAAAAFLERAVALTDDPARRADRAFAAAQASLGAGAFDRARGLLAAAEGGPLDELGRARVDLLRAEVAFAQNRGREAPLLLLHAARKLETLDVRLSRDTYLDAWGAALFAGRMASAGSGLLDVSRAVATAPEADPLLPRDLLLSGLALLFTEGRRSATPALRRAVAAFASTEISEEEMLRGGWLATRAANVLWDYDSCLEIGTRVVRLARDSGALAVLAAAANGCGQTFALGGDLASAALLAAELDAVREATGSRVAQFAAIALAGIRGREDEASELIEGTIRAATAGGQGTAVQYAHWANSVLMNGLGRYEEALAAAVEASEHTPELFIASWALSELIEAATRTENAELARSALARLTEHTECDADWALGIHARACALMTEREAAEPLYREAIERLGRTRLRPELARAHLLYGEWLRRKGRRVDAREQLRTAHDMLDAIGMEAFAERARRELRATGESVRKRNHETRDQLTPQEEQIALLARDGLSNPEIGAQLFLSPRTVEWHLRKVFTKLGISSRKQLRIALAESGRPVASA